MKCSSEQSQSGLSSSAPHSYRWLHSHGVSTQPGLLGLAAHLDLNDHWGISSSNNDDERKRNWPNKEWNAHQSNLKADSLLQLLTHTVGFTHMGNQFNQVFLDQQLIWIWMIIGGLVAVIMMMKGKGIDLTENEMLIRAISKRTLFFSSSLIPLASLTWGINSTRSSWISSSSGFKCN